MFHLPKSHAVKNLLLGLSCALVLTCPALATVTLQFNESYVSGIPSNFANSSGIVTNGMRWGIIVSTSDSSFAGGGTSYDEYTYGPGTAGFLSYGGVATDDYYIPGFFTGDATSLLEGDITTPGGQGSIIEDLIFSLTGGVSTGDRFALIWFSDNTSAAGSKYGFFTDTSFVLPSDGATGEYGAVFVGVDPIRSASNTFAASVIPEPSRALLLFVGVVGLMMRRRRA